MSEKRMLDVAAEGIGAGGLDSMDVQTAQGLGELVGAYKAFALSASINRFFQAKMIAKVHTGKAYKEVYGTFDNFCTSVGISRRKAYELLDSLNHFGEEAYKGLLDLNMKEKDLKLLKAAKVEVEVDDDEALFLEIDGERIFITSDNRDELVEAVARLERSRDDSEAKLDYERQEKKDAQGKVAELEEKIVNSRRLPSDLAGLQEKCGALQDGLLSVSREIDRATRSISSGDDPRIEVIENMVSWIDRWSMRLHARYLQDGQVSDEDFYATSYANPENITR